MSSEIRLVIPPIAPGTSLNRLLLSERWVRLGPSPEGGLVVTDHTMFQITMKTEKGSGIDLWHMLRVWLGCG